MPRARSALSAVTLLMLLSGPAMARIHFPPGFSSGKRLVKKVKNSVSELIRNPGDYGTSRDDTFRDLERTVTHVLWPLTGRVVDVVPAGFSTFDWQVLAGLTFVSTIAGTVGDYCLRDNNPIDNYGWKRFGSGSPIASFIRGAYGGVGISAIGLGIVLPAISGGVQLEPLYAAGAIAATSLTSGTLRAIGKVLGNRKRANDTWLRSAERALHLTDEGD